MVFWPSGSGNGEPDELRYRAGRIDYCLKAITTDPSCLRLFGSATRATAALCQFEFCLELNSYLATNNPDARESYEYVTKKYPGMFFTSWPSLIAFPLEHISDLASKIFVEIKQSKPEIFRLILFDPVLAGSFLMSGSDLIFARYLGNLVSESAQLHLQLYHFPAETVWPSELDAAMKLARKQYQQAK